MTHDADVRPLLRAHLAATYPGAMVVDELGLDQGSARADLAVIGDSIHGFEIKAEADTLTRLRTQVHFYGWVCDRVTLVVARCHLAAAAERVPAWWGLWVIEADGFVEARAAGVSPEVALHKQAALLWRAEAASLLESRTRKLTPSRMTKRDIQRALVAAFSPDDLRAGVRAALRARANLIERSAQAGRAA